MTTTLRLLVWVVSTELLVPAAASIRRRRLHWNLLALEVVPRAAAIMMRLCFPSGSNRISKTGFNYSATALLLLQDWKEA